MTIRTLVLAVAALLLPLRSGAVDAFVVPSDFASAESPDGGNALPFGASGGDTRCQQIYLDADIPDGPFTIHGLAFRPDKAGTAFTKSLASADVVLSTTELGSTALNANFAANVGFAPTLVRSGPLELSTQFVGPEDGPKEFDAFVWFDTPFEYDGGDVLVDVRVNSSEPLNRFLEPADLPGDAIGRVCSVGAFGGGVDAPTGETLDSGGLVTKCLLVPEPASLASAIVACAALARLARRS